MFFERKLNEIISFQLTYSIIILISSYVIGFGLSLVLEIPIAKWQLKEPALKKATDVTDKKEAEDSSDKKKAE